MPAERPGVAATPRSVADLLRELRGTVPEITTEQLASSREALVVDVREADEWQAGHVPGATHLPRGFLEMRIEALAPDRATPLLLYCAGGNRSLLAAESLARLGYTRASSVAGGFKRWKDEGRAIEVPASLGDDARQRYARHLVIPEVGEAGQAKLLASKVLVVGAGGLGCPSALYLAAAGVGTLTILDDDAVDLSNLQRQVLHDSGAVGRNKALSAQQRLSALNPGVRVDARQERLSVDNVEALLPGHDVVVDGTDNFATRYLVNDACMKHGIPNVHGSVFRFEGQCSVFWRGHGPCYRCVYPEPPPEGLAPNCAEAGVLGVMPGLIGLLQAVETLKILLGIGDSLAGRLLTYDALAGSFLELQLRQDPGCRWCAAGAPFPGYANYRESCASD